MKWLAPAAALAGALALSCSSPLPGGEREPTGQAGSGGQGGEGGAPPVTPTNASARCETSEVAPATLRRLTRLELENTLADLFPEISANFSGVALGPDPLSRLEFTNDARTLLVGPQTAREIFKTVEQVATLVTSPATLPTLLPCVQSAPDRACAEVFVDGYGPRIFRRPLTQGERADFLSYFDSVLARSDFAVALKWTLVSLLQAPQAVYRSEIGDSSGKLTPYELATALSYTYGGTTPTPEFMARAASGELGSPEALVQTASQLLSTERGRETLRRFFREWSGYREVAGTTKDAVPSFAPIETSMVEETQRFIDDVLDSGGGVPELLTASYTFLNDELSRFYGYGSASVDFVRTQRPPEYGVGLLAQGSLLAGKAHPNYSSPVFRGLVVFTKLLCNEPPPVPAVVPNLVEPVTPTTTRQRFEEAHAQGPCATCHQAFEPFGFAMEHFDETGRYRADENGLPIDATGAVTLNDGSELAFDGLTDLATKLSASESVTDCVSGLLTAYAFAGGGGQGCLAEEARSRLAAGEIGLLQFYAELARAPSFTERAR